MAYRQVATCLFIFLVGLLPRVLSLSAFITWDEPMWTYRAVRFMAALAEGRWADTFVVGHPRVTTMELGAVGIALSRLLSGGPPAADWAWLRDLPHLDPRNLEALRRAAAFLPAARLPLAIVAALAVVGLYALTRRLFDIWAETTAPVVSASYPTTAWREGDVLPGRYDLIVDRWTRLSRYGEIIEESGVEETIESLPVGASRPDPGGLRAAHLPAGPPEPVGGRGHHPEPLPAAVARAAAEHAG